MKPNRYLQVLSVLSVAAVLVCIVASSPVAARDTPNPNSQNPNTTYQTIPITIQMEAGRAQWNPWTSGTTMIAGTGWIAPFGRADYHYEFPANKFAEDTAELKPDFMEYDSWKNYFTTTTLCIYHLEEGDLYTYGGIAKNLEPASGDDGKTDYILEVIVGGTGKYRNANGMVLGRTAGRGAGALPTYGDKTGPVPLPVSIVKTMEGYVNIVVKKSKYTVSLPAIGTKNPQRWPEAADYLDAGALVPINIEMEAGRAQWNPWTSGNTIIAGIGWIEPFGRSDYHYGTGYAEAGTGDGEKPAFMTDASWKTPYPTNNLCIYHLSGGDIYAYDGIVGNLVPASDDGKVDCIVEVIVGGTGDYEGATGMILGYTFGRGDAEIPVYEDDDGNSTSGPYPLPESIVKIMEGYVLIK